VIAAGDAAANGARGIAPKAVGDQPFAAEQWSRIIAGGV
jgi:hypothetical protein